MTYTANGLNGSPVRRMGLTGALVLAAFGLAACGDDDPKISGKDGQKSGGEYRDEAAGTQGRASVPQIKPPMPSKETIPDISQPGPTQVMPSPAPNSGVAAGSGNRQKRLHARPAYPPRVIYHPPRDRENYAHLDGNPIKAVRENPVSTFSVDVDTGSYANLRRFLNHGRQPVRDAIRTEELINYFSYDLPAPESRAEPFRITTEVAPTPWNAQTHLMQVSLKAFEVPRADRPPANLVFLIDVSGSMRSRNKLPLLKASFKMLSEQLGDDDRVSIVTYANGANVVLPATPGKDKAKIRAAIDGLQARGSTNGGAGIELAYAEALSAFKEKGLNRVVLATDGDLNVGVVKFDALLQMIEEKRKSGVELTTLGFGTGNYNDKLLEQLADAGDGNHAYVDSLSEAQKVLVSELMSTFHTVARDVKIQVEFNPAVVAEYRLIGYENRQLKREDFRNDKVDAGEVGSGHRVTALYEIALVGSEGRRLGDLRYQDEIPPNGPADELAFVKVRYKQPAETKSRLMSVPVKTAAIRKDMDETHARFRFAAAVAGFGQILKGGKYTGAFTMKDVKTLASDALGEDRHGYRREFIRLVGLAESVSLASRRPDGSHNTE